MWVRYYIMSRSGQVNHLHLGRKLYQQYLTDEFERHQTMELSWMRNNQTTIRADLYKNLENSVTANTVQNSGRVTILPASYTCSERWYHKNYSNAMALVRKKGCPTFFVTYTLDIGCPEVKECLAPGQVAYDRPDILNRIFQMKKKKLLDLLTKQGVLGDCDGYVAVVEFQKRGAPHCHILIWIKNFHKTPNNIDNIISAELPPSSDPLHKTVLKYMVHGPCGRAYNSNLACCKNSKDGSCSKNFPKMYNQTTIIDGGGYPEYRRRSPGMGGHVGSKKVNGIQVEIDNKWVVPYSPYLLKRFGSHINVEFCASVTSIKYLFGYQFKGEDMVTIEEADMNDEISRFQTRKYISACYGHFRLAEFPMAVVKPPVLQLPVHLPNEQNVTYQADQASAEAMLETKKYTQLTEYFTANALHEETDLLYEDYPVKYVWRSDTQFWANREKETVDPCAVGRMVTIHPTSGELFYLRLLLKHRAGAISYEDLRTIDGIVHDDFKSACIYLELCEDDTEWINCLNEAVLLSRPYSIRCLFSNIVLHCHPTGPAELYQQFKDAMSEDFLYKRRNILNLTDDQKTMMAYNDLLSELNNFFLQLGKTNSTFYIPMPEQISTPVVIEDTSDFDPNAEAFYDEHRGDLNEDQEEVFNAITNSVDNSDGQLFKLDAPGGCGKTHVSKVTLCYVRKNGGVAIACAISGIAATLLPLATTYHRRFGVPIPCYRDSCSNIKLNSRDAQYIKMASLIMIDEVSMMDFKILDLLNRFLQVLMENEKLMGGKTVVLMHDFRQCPPVVPGGSRAAVISTTVKSSDIWSHFKPLSLKLNMRVERLIIRDPTRAQRLKEYGEWLLSVGNGSLPTIFNDIIEIPDHMVRKSCHQLETSVYVDFEQNMFNEKYLSERCIMSSTNEVIQERNFQMINKLPGELIESFSVDSCVEDDDQALYDEDFLNKINTSGLPPHRLAFKKGSCIILIKNLDVKNKHVNGQRYIIVDLTRHLIKARKLGGGTNSELLIPRIPMISKDSKFPVPFKRLQFPVLGAYYLTINRAQGQTLMRSGVYLPTSVFCHGHLYVALGRNGDPDQVFVFADQSEFDNIKKFLDPGKTYTRNIVYPELLGE